MKFVTSWIFWIIYALVPFLLTLLAGLSRETMVILYVFALLAAIVMWWIYEKTHPKAENEV